MPPCKSSTCQPAAAELGAATPSAILKRERDSESQSRTVAAKFCPRRFLALWPAAFVWTCCRSLSRQTRQHQQQQDLAVCAAEMFDGKEMQLPRGGGLAEKRSKIWDAYFFALLHSDQLERTTTKKKKKKNDEQRRDQSERTLRQIMGSLNL